MIVSWLIKKGKNLELKNTMYWVFLGVKVEKMRGRGGFLGCWLGDFDLPHWGTSNYFFGEEN
jgi:hypothetical protein